MSYQYPKTTELIERDEEIKRLERENGQLREALKEARCWIVTGGRLTPEERGAKLEWASDVEVMIDAALASPAPAYVQQTAKDTSGDTPRSE